ncbi:MAG: PAS domain S-box protein [Theionarchaea archaeon]|nr:PAS domain S-box protein [Theionarchaea archaeon]
MADYDDSGAPAKKQIDRSLLDLIEIIHFTEKVSTKIHGILDEDEIFRTVKEESKKSKKYTVSIMLFAGDGSRLRVAESSIPIQTIKAAEKTTGLKFKGFTFDADKSRIYRQVVREGKTVQARVDDIVSELFPRPLAYVISKLLNYSEKFSILTPLRRHGIIIGAVAMTSTELGEYFIPSVKSLAQHISTSLELSDEYKERSRMEEALRESEKRYRLLAENATDVIWTVDMNLHYTYVSPFAEQLLGYSLESIVNRGVQKILTLSSFEAAMEVFKEELAKEETKKDLSRSRTLELELVRKDGSTVWTESRMTFLRDTEGVAVGILGVLRDITERKQAEEELEQYRHHLEELVKERTTALTETNVQLQEEIRERKVMEESLAAEKERLSVTLRSIGDGVITTDMNGTVVLINKVAEALTGYTQEEAVGKQLNTVFYIVNEKTRLPCENPVDKVLFQGVIVGLGNDTVLISKDGTERVIADSGAPIRDKNSRIIGVVLVFRDITEKQKTEQELLRTQKLESLGNLAGGIAHDFNNILTAILSNANLAKIYTKDNRLVEKLTKIEKASLQAKELTQQLLTFSKGGAPIKKATSLQELIRDSTSFALRGSNVRCHFYIPDDLSPADIDEGQVSQVINNLIMNADEAMPEGGVIQVKAENVFIDEGVLPLKRGDYVKISIKDQGVGIPKKYLQKIFDPYFTTKQKGSGLGLSTSYSIVMKHDGYITAESEGGKGTTFYIYLPASQMVRDEQEEGGELVKGKGRVLLMDDEEIVRDAAGEVLQYLGYTVVTVADGEEAISAYTRALKSGEPFDIVIMDLTIPGGKGGKEAITTLLQVDPHVRAIVASGYSTDPVMADYRKYGFSGVVCKPYTIEDLSRVLYRMLKSEEDLSSGN